MYLIAKPAREIPNGRWLVFPGPLTRRTYLLFARNLCLQLHQTPTASFPSLGKGCKVQIVFLYLRIKVEFHVRHFLPTSAEARMGSRGEHIEIRVAGSVRMRYQARTCVD